MISIFQKYIRRKHYPFCNSIPPPTWTLQATWLNVITNKDTNTEQQWSILRVEQRSKWQFSMNQVSAHTLKGSCGAIFVCQLQAKHIPELYYRHYVTKSWNKQKKRCTWLFLLLSFVSLFFFAFFSSSSSCDVCVIALKKKRDAR